MHLVSKMHLITITSTPFTRDLFKELLLINACVSFLKAELSDENKLGTKKNQTTLLGLKSNTPHSYQTRA